MGHSFTGIGEIGFYAQDTKVGVWMRLLAREARNKTPPLDWLKEAADHWDSQLQHLMGVGCLHPRLDDFLIDKERVAILSNLAQRVFSQLRMFGEKIPRDFLNDLCGYSTGDRFTEDVPTECFLRYGRALLKLLRGKMRKVEYA